jgi:Holliday junction resolvasome RuvABC endonuclease subunit
MNILAFDLASTTGVAFGRPGATPRFWTEVLGKAGQDQAIRFSQALHMTQRLINELQPDLLAIEAPLAAGGGGAQSRAELAMGIRGCVMGIAHHKRVPVVQYAVPTIRKHFIDHGRLERSEAKRATIARCRQLGCDVANDNEADAVALFYLTCAKQGAPSCARMGGLFDSPHQAAE